MADNDTPEPKGDVVVWYVYLLRCRDNTLYAGITTDLKKRLKAHNSGLDGAKYTRTRRPVKLVYTERFASRSAAARREHELKKMGRLLKLKLLSTGEAETGGHGGAAP